MIISEKYGEMCSQIHNQYQFIYRILTSMCSRELKSN